MSYEKKFGVGNVYVDMPYAQFIHELPLLSFGDVQHNINVSLIYQSKEADNPFNIANGFKLNLQKRLIMNSSNIPEKFEDANGKLIKLNRYGDRYVFDDGSQRIIRSDSGPFVLENPDYSKEIYDDEGRITAVCDKYGNNYLTYSYQNGNLDCVKYRNKTIQLGYSGTPTRLQSLQYICNGETICTTNFVYSQGNVSVKHYCGVTYDIGYSSGNLTVCATANSEDYSPHWLECTLSSASLVVKETIGDTVVDRTTYDFIWSNDADKFDIWDVTNYSGVKTRIQFKDGKPIYSYEVREDMFVKQSDSNEDTPLDPYFGSVTYYDNNEDIGTQEDGKGTPMSYDRNGYQWEFPLASEIKVKNVTVSGWIYKKVENNISFNSISVSLDDSTTGEGDIVSFDDLPEKEWVYFSYVFKVSKLYNPQVCVRRDGDNIGLFSTKDFRITLHYENEEDNTPKVQTFVIDKVSTEGETEIPLNPEPIEGAEDSEQPKVIFYNGNSKIDQQETPITENDVIRFMINQVYGTHTNEIYFNNCKGVMLSNNEDGLRVAYSDANRTTPIIDLKSARIEKRYSIKNDNYVTKIEFDSSSNAEYGMVVQSLCNDICYQAAYYGAHDLDLLASKNEQVETSYVRNNCGLITSQTIADDEGAELCTTYTSYDETCTKVVSTTNEFGQMTQYTTDDVWGVVTEVKLSDDTIIKNCYDDDMSTLRHKIFSKDNKEKQYGFAYPDAQCFEIWDDTLQYTSETAWGRNGEQYVKKLGVPLETHRMSVTEGTFEDDYPDYLMPEYTHSGSFDKYGRVTQIDGLLTNTYGLAPVYIPGEGGSQGQYGFLNINNSNSQLAESKDLTTQKVTKYAYNSGRLSNIAEFNQINAMINEKTFTYDAKGRLSEDKYVYDLNRAQSVGSEIVYEKGDTHPAADNTVVSYTYKVNTVGRARISNARDAFKRITKKDITLSPYGINVEKKFSYNKTRVSDIQDNCKGVNLGRNSYSYDALGRIRVNTYVSNSTARHHKSYEYDEFGQLIRENNEALDKTYVYEYNDIGNLTLVKEYDRYIPEEALPSCYKSIVYEYDSECPDRLTKFDGNEIEYNSIGCPTKYKDENYEWTNGKLSKIHRSKVLQGNEHYMQYTLTYDGYGRRTRKHYISGINYRPADSEQNYSFEHTIDYTYDNNGRLIREFRTDVDTYSGVTKTTRELIYLYDDSGSIIGVMYSLNGVFPEPYYYHRNLQGDVIAIYDANGNKQVEYAYDAWGNCETVYQEDDELAYLNPIRYRGYYYDTETGLYYLNARYYSPEWRRFISPDAAEYIDPETPNGLNLYAYCNNDPVNFADPSGHWIETVFDLFSLGASVVEVVINPANPWAWAGLVGDAVDLLPFVTGVGEGIRVTKMVKYADEVIDASYDTIKFVKAADMVDNFSDSGTMLRRVGNLDDYHTLTKTTHVDGTNLHTLFMGNGKTIADTRKRVDGINEITKSIFELKPYNLHSARRGVKQIINYNDLLGGGFKMVIVLY